MTDASRMLDSVDELTEMAVKLFSPVPNRSLPPPPLITESPFGADHRGVSHSFFALLMPLTDSSPTSDCYLRENRHGLQRSRDRVDRPLAGSIIQDQGWPTHSTYRHKVAANIMHQPANFVTHFLGHEGPGSLHSYLKNKGWITYLSAGPNSGAPGFDFLKVTLVLTQDGFGTFPSSIKRRLFTSLLR